MPGRFFDSNVLVYAVSAEIARADAAKAVLREGGSISVQVLNEVANVARRKMAMDWWEVRDILDLFGGLLQVSPVTFAVHGRGIDLAERHGFAIYDSMIVAAALESGCDVLYSEDMHHRMRIDDRLTIVNPFA